MDTHLRALARVQFDVVAAWQLRRLGWSWDRIGHRRARGGWRTIHPGVYVLSASPVTRQQLWFAAVLTAPGTVLSHGSAGACYGFHRFQRGYEVVTRPGHGGRRRHGRLLVFRSTWLEGQVTRFDGIPIATAARTLVDLAPGLDDDRLARAFRESIRLKRTTARRVLDAAQRRAGGPGVSRLAERARRYARIPYQRTRSDPEGRALELVHDAGMASPRVNVRVGGEEADLVFDHSRVIVEIDGPQFHRFRDEDLRKEQAWREAGFVVRRVPSDRVYKRPDELLCAARNAPAPHGT